MTRKQLIIKLLAATIVAPSPMILMGAALMPFIQAGTLPVVVLIVMVLVMWFAGLLAGAAVFHRADNY